MTRKTKEILIGTLIVFIFAGAFGLISRRTESASQTRPDDGYSRISGIYKQVDGLFPGDQAGKIIFLASNNLDVGL